MATPSTREPAVVFLSYRRDDSQHFAGRLYDRLTDRFGVSGVFMDIDSIRPGADFAETVVRAVAECDVLLAVVGQRWVDARHDDGGRRLDDPADFVALELRAALERDVVVIPVLVDGATIPRPEDLPPELAGFARRNAMRVDHETFRSDVTALLDAISRVREGRRTEEEPAGSERTAPTSPSVLPEGRSPHPAERSRTRDLRRIGALAVVVVVLLSGLGLWLSTRNPAGGGSAGAGPTTTAPDDVPSTAPITVSINNALAAQVPPSVAADGKLVFGTDASYPPNEFTGPDGITIVGMDVDLGTAVAQKLGLSAEFQNTVFSSIIPDLQSGRFELGMSAFSVTPERLQTVDMVSYFVAVTSVAVRSGNPDGIDANDLCGRSVGVQAGTIQVDDLAARDEQCTASGKPAIQVTELQSQTDVTLALTDNRIVAMLGDSPVVDHAVTTTGGAIEVVGQPHDAAPYGIVLEKDQDQFGQAVQGAVQALIADGTYAAILEKWNVQAGAITTAQLNPAP